MTDTIVPDFDPDYIAKLRERIQAKQHEFDTDPAAVGLIPLPIKCVMTSCQHGRHCVDFLRKPRKGAEAVDPGDCRDCGSHVVDLGAGVHHDGDVESLCETLLAQQSELIRAHYWNVAIDRRAYNQALRLGKLELRSRVEARVLEAVGGKGAFAGRGAPYAHDIVAYAQHATATCCRRCAAYWHGLPQDPNEAASSAQLKHVVAMALAYVELRLPGLPELPVERVPAISKLVLPSPDESDALDELVVEQLAAGEDPVGLMVPESTHIHLTDSRNGLLITRSLRLDVGA